MVATPLPMLPCVDEAERERYERRLERDRRRREQGRTAYFESEPREPEDDRGVLTSLEAEAFDEEGFATQTGAGVVPPAVAQEPPDTGKGLVRSGVIFAVATALSRIIG